MAASLVRGGKHTAVDVAKTVREAADLGARHQ